jgi:hypothetical protein
LLLYLSQRGPTIFIRQAHPKKPAFSSHLKSLDGEKGSNNRPVLLMQHNNSSLLQTNDLTSST